MTQQEHYGGTSATSTGIPDTSITDTGHTDASVTVFIDEETLTMEEWEAIADEPAEE